MRKILSITCAVLFAIASTPAWSWGLKGHRVVGAIADIVLQRQHPETHERIRDMLGTNLSELATWPDCAKGATVCGTMKPAWQRYTDRNDRHKEFHFTDVPIQRNRYAAGIGGTHRDDVVQILRHSVKLLRGQPTNNGPNGIADLLEKEAIWVIAHLVGDIHQPMHVGAVFYDETCKRQVDPNDEGANLPNFGIGTKVAETRGGGRLFHTATQNMHSFWDNTAVDGALGRAGANGASIDLYARFVADNPPAGWQMTGVDVNIWGHKWADESLRLSQQAHDPVRITIKDGIEQDNAHELECRWPVELADGYRDWAAERAHEQLAKAGFRLAAMLHEAMKD